MGAGDMDAKAHLEKTLQAATNGQDIADTLDRECSRLLKHNQKDTTDAYICFLVSQLESYGMRRQSEIVKEHYPQHFGEANPKPGSYTRGRDREEFFAFRERPDKRLG